MKSRGLALGAALLLAVLAAGAVFLYVQGVHNQARTGGGMVTVVVSKQEIPAGTHLDSLVTAGDFTTLQVPQADLVQGAVTDLNQLRGQVTAYPILANEQISTARFRGPQQASGGVLGIPAGYQALTLSLSPQQIVGGNVQQGDHVTLYGVVNNPGTTGGNAGGQTTVTLVAQTLVLQAPPLVNGVVPSSNELITVALKPADAEAVVLTQQTGQVWLSLLPPNQSGVPVPPMTAQKVAQR